MLVAVEGWLKSDPFTPLLPPHLAFGHLLPRRGEERNPRVLRHVQKE